MNPEHGRHIEAEQSYPERLVQDHLSSIDQNSIKSYFQSIYQKSGIDREVSYYSDITNTDNSQHLGNCSIEDKKIGINMREIYIESKEDRVEPRAKFLHTLIHEQTHAATEIPCSPGSNRSGFALKEGEKRTFEIFNEGVTEKLATDLTAKYLEEHPDFLLPEDRERYMQYLSDPEAEKSYDLPVAMVELMIKKIARSSGISEKTVWEGVLRQQFEGNGFNDSELREMFAECFGENFLDKLAKINTAEDQTKILNLVRRMDATHITEEEMIRITELFTKWNIRQL